MTKTYKKDQEKILSIIMRRDSMSREDAVELFQDALDQVADGANPEDVLHDDLGLEPDYMFAMLDW